MRLPKGFRVEADDSVFRAMQQRSINAKNNEKAMAKKKKAKQIFDASIAAKNAKVQAKEDQRLQAKSLIEAARM